MFGSRFCQMGWKPSLISPISSSSSSSSSSAYAALHNCRVEDVYRWWWLTYLLPTPHKQQIPSFCLCGSTPFFFYLVPSVKTEKELNRIIDVCDPYHFPNPPLFIHRSATGAAMGFRDPPILSNRCPLRCATTGLVDWRVAPPLEKRTTGEGGHVTRLKKCCRFWHRALTTAPLADLNISAGGRRRLKSATTKGPAAVDSLLCGGVLNKKKRFLYLSV